MEHARFAKIIYTACDLLEKERLECSCGALEDGIYYNSRRPYNYREVRELQERYGKFFGKNCGHFWFPSSPRHTGINPQFKHERIMCLLMFLEAEKDVVK